MTKTFTDKLYKPRIHPAFYVICILNYIPMSMLMLVKIWDNLYTSTKSIDECTFQWKHEWYKFGEHASCGIFILICMHVQCHILLSRCDYLNRQLAHETSTLLAFRLVDNIHLLTGLVVFLMKAWQWLH